MKRFTFGAVVFVGLALVAVNVLLAQSSTAMAVVRDPGCGCCLNWVAHLEQAGFKTTVAESAEMDAVKDRHGIPKTVRSCHTGTIGGYVIEGHVPAADVKRLLQERPNIVGIAVPGMPAGSPGMELPNGRVAAYDVIAFDKAGKTSVFASHR